jgi:hypothetical protein
MDLLATARKEIMQIKNSTHDETVWKEGGFV